MKKRSFLTFFIILAGALVIALSLAAVIPTLNHPPSFNGERAYADVLTQDSFGPRFPGTDGHDRIVQWISSQLTQNNWQVEVQQTSLGSHPIQNIIARRGSANQPWLILGAHFDTRMVSDQDPTLSKRNQPMPGANDGGSGVAVLLELARDLPSNLQKQVWLVFFDAEDQGGLPGWDWILGSRAFANSLTAKPDAAVIVDMIGDKDLNIYKELNSDPTLTDSIWKIAASLGYQKQFIPQGKYRMEDDHTPFLEKGITAVDIIDFDYPYWHTTSDTPDKVSAASLQVVGDTLLKWLMTA
jgi:glutaminyl-peptide cyclotransferase